MEIRDGGQTGQKEVDRPLAEYSNDELTSLFDMMLRNRNTRDVISFLEGRTNPETNAEVRIQEIHRLMVVRGIPAFSITQVASTLDN